MSGEENKTTQRGSAPTIREVAKQAGVSIKTVSRMLSGHEGVRDETRRRIQEVMDGMEYYPSAAARSLRGQGTGLIALITDHLTTTPDSFEIVKGVQSACDKHGKLLLIGETSGQLDAFERLVTEFRRQRPEAVIRAVNAHGEVKVTQTFSTCPLVLVNCFESEARYATILPDDQGGALEATRLVIQRGHRRVAHLGLPSDMIATQLRLEGYLAAHRELQLPIDDQLIHVGASLPELDEFRILPQIIKTLLEMPDPPTVLMCGNDKMAMRALMILNQLGHRVPDDISLVGYDDYHLISENLIPQLSTVSLPYFEMGVRATEMAITKASHERVLMPCPFVSRETVKTLHS